MKSINFKKKKDFSKPKPFFKKKEAATPTLFLRDKDNSNIFQANEYYKNKNHGYFVCSKRDRKKVLLRERRNNSAGRPINSKFIRNNHFFDNIKIPDNAEVNIYIKDINYEANEDDLKYTFNKYGPIQSVKILRDKENHKSKGRGFVKFTDLKSAVLALNDADNLVCKGRNVLVRFANDKEGEFKGKKKGPFLVNYNPNRSDIDENRVNEYRNKGIIENKVRDIQGRVGFESRGSKERGRGRKIYKRNDRGRGSRKKLKRFDQDNSKRINFRNLNKEEDDNNLEQLNKLQRSRSNEKYFVLDNSES